MSNFINLGLQLKSPYLRTIYLVVMSAPLNSRMYICSLLVSYNHDLSGVSLETFSALKKHFCQVKSFENKWIPIKQMVYVVQKCMVSDLVGLKSNQKYVVHGLW